MKLISMLLAIVFLTGCTTTQTFESESGKLREQLADGNEISPGAVAFVETFDGEHHKFRVKKVTDDDIVGETVKVPIDDVAFISTEYTVNYLWAGGGILYLLLIFIPYTL